MARPRPFRKSILRHQVAARTVSVRPGRPSPAQPQEITDRVDQDHLRPNAFRNAIPFARDEGIVEPGHQRCTIPVKQPGFSGRADGAAERMEYVDAVGGLPEVAPSSTSIQTRGDRPLVAMGPSVPAGTGFVTLAGAP